MNHQIKKHEADLLALLRLCEPRDEVKIIIGDSNWIVLVDKHEKVIFSLEGIAK